MLYDRQKVLLIGLGIQGGGVATAIWLVNQGAELTIVDQKEKKLLAASLKKLKGYSIKYIFGEPKPRSVAGFSMVVQNPAVPSNHPLILAAKKRHIPIENEASLFFKNCRQLIVGITGSKGKSTTSSLLGHIVNFYKPNTIVAGNIRDRIMLDVLPKLKSKNPVILELSSWHLEILGQWQLSPDISVITNLLPDHLNRYRSMSEYAQAKANIFKWQDPNDSVVLNYDNILTRKISRQAHSRIYWFSVNKVMRRGAFIKSGAICFADRGMVEVVVLLKDIKLLGQHNLYNVLAAVAAARVLGVPSKYIKKGLVTFTGLHSRLQLIRTWRGIDFYNDTAATAPDATIAALNSFVGRKIILIAGGTDKKLPYQLLAKEIKNKATELILLPGTATDKLLFHLGKNYLVHSANSMVKAVRLATQLAKRGAVVLLSPGAASFGLFKNEWDRGEQFIKAVRKLA